MPKASPKARRRSEEPLTGEETLERFWERHAAFKALSDECGGLVSPGGAARLLGVSRQAVHVAIWRGTLTVHRLPEGDYIGMNQIRDRLLHPNKGGRPPGS